MRYQRKTKTRVALGAALLLALAAGASMTPEMWRYFKIRSM